MRSRVFLCVSIDCECDKGRGWRTRKPLTFDGVHAGVGERLHPLFRRFGAKPTYLLSPELADDPQCVEALASLRDCELGAHLHGELAGPDRFVPDVTEALQRDYAPDVERAKLVWLTETFRRAFGRPPRSFRAGRFGIGAHTVPILEELGYVVDSSVTPHVDWSRVSPGLTFVRSPTQPYHPDPRDPGRPGTSTLLEVPVTIRPPLFSRVPVLGTRLAARWLRPTRRTGRQLIKTTRDEIGAVRRREPGRTVVLNAMLHNVEVVAGASPYAATESQAMRILDRLGALLRFARDADIPCVGLSDVPEVVGG
jgi:hypothetical protein